MNSVWLVHMKTCSVWTSALSQISEQHYWKEIMYAYSNSFQPVFLKFVCEKENTGYELKMCSPGYIFFKTMILERDADRGCCLLRNHCCSFMRSSISRVVLVGVLPSVQPVLCSPAVSQHLENSFGCFIVCCPAEFWKRERKGETAVLHWVIMNLWERASPFPHIYFLGSKNRMKWVPAIS